MTNRQYIKAKRPMTKDQKQALFFDTMIVLLCLGLLIAYMKTALNPEVRSQETGVRIEQTAD